MDRRILLTTAIVLAVMMAFVPVADADAEEFGNGDLVCTIVNEDGLSINAMSSAVFEVDIYNKSSEPYELTASFESAYSGLSAQKNSDIMRVEPNGYITVPVNVSTAKYVEEGTYVLTVHLFPHTTGNLSMDSIDIDMNISVHSAYANGDTYNRIMGIWNNPLPSPMNSPMASGLISLVIWILLAGVLSFGITAILGRIIIRNKVKSAEEEANGKKLKGMWKFLFAIFIMYGITECLIISGAGENIVGTVADVTSILFTLCGAMIVWTVFRTFVVEIGINKMDDDYALTPLILMIGKITIFFGTAMATLAVFGINLISIITAMGLITTGISLGAKNVIGQFISGLIILIERPFVIGDKIKVGGDSEVLVVRNIGFMTTTFKRWVNEEVYIIPNSVLMDSQLINITRDNVNYKVYDYYTIDHDSDIGRAREILLQCAYEHPGVVTEGAFGKPDVKFFGVDRTQITLRLSFTVSDHENFGTYAGEIRKRVFEMFTEEGISIPYVQVTANMIRPKVTLSGEKDPDGI